MLFRSYRKAQGISNSIVSSGREAKSISTEQTFSENIFDENTLLIELAKMIEKVAYELRNDKMLTGCIAVKIRYANFETTQKQTTIDFTLSDEVLIKEATKLFHKLWRKPNVIRLLGVRLSEFTNQSFQGNLFDNHTLNTKLYNAIDDVKNRFGKSTLQKGSTVKKKK